MAYSLILLSLFLPLLPTLVQGHGCVVNPPFRGTLKSNSITVPQHDDLDDIEADGCPHCLNGGGKGVVTMAANANWKPYRPLDPKQPFRMDTGLCGDPFSQSSPREHEIGGKFGPSKKMPYVAVYKPGDIVEFVADITTNHNGFFEFFLCDLDKCPGNRMSHKCFKGGHCRSLKRVKHPVCESMKSKQCAPVDPDEPGRWYVPCRSGGHVGEHFMGGKYMQYRLPKGFSCAHCVIQWYWATANSCNPPGFKEYFEKFPMPGWGKCPGDGGAFGGRNPGLETCGGDTFPEEFWMCADVRITGDGVGVPKIMPRPGKGEMKFADLLQNGPPTAEAADDDDDDDDDDDEKEDQEETAPKNQASTPPSAGMQQKRTVMQTPPPSAPVKKEGSARQMPMPPIMKPDMNKYNQPPNLIAQGNKQPPRAAAKSKAAANPRAVAPGSQNNKNNNQCSCEPGRCVQTWQQCGGAKHQGGTKCCDTQAECTVYSKWHSMCVRPEQRKMK